MRRSPSRIRSRRGGEDVRVPVDRRDDVGAGFDLEVFESVGTLARDRCEQTVRIRHHVADDLRPPGDALSLEDRARALVRAQEEVSDAVDLDAVVLLRHRQIARAHPRLDMG